MGNFCSSGGSDIPVEEKNNYSLKRSNIKAKFLSYCEEGNLKEAKKLYSLDDFGDLNIYLVNYDVLRMSCKKGYINIAQWLYSLGGINTHVINHDALILSCAYGHINIAQWLYSLGAHIHVNHDDAFVLSCEFGYMNIVQWLYSLGGVDIHTWNDNAFRGSCRNGHIHIVQLLLSLDKFDNKLVDEHLPEKLYEYAFQLGYLPTNKMKSAYETYKTKIREQVKEKRIDGPISLFEMNGLVDLIVRYV